MFDYKSAGHDIIHSIFTEHKYEFTKYGYHTNRLPMFVPNFEEMLHIYVNPVKWLVTFKMFDITYRENIPYKYLVDDNVNSLFDWIDLEAIRHMNIICTIHSLMKVRWELSTEDNILHKEYTNKKLKRNIKFQVNLRRQLISCSTDIGSKVVDIPIDIYNGRSHGKIPKYVMEKVRSIKNNYFNNRVLE